MPVYAIVEEIHRFGQALKKIIWGGGGGGGGICPLGPSLDPPLPQSGGGHPLIASYHAFLTTLVFLLH